MKERAARRLERDSRGGKKWKGKITNRQRRLIDCWRGENDGVGVQVLQVKEQRQNSSHQVKVRHARSLWR